MFIRAIWYNRKLSSITCTCINLFCVYIASAHLQIISVSCCPLVHVHRVFTVHISLAFARSAFAHRSAFTYRSPTCVQRSDLVPSAFAQRSFSVRSPFTHRSLTVRSSFKWESRTFQGLYYMILKKFKQGEFKMQDHLFFENLKRQ